MTATKTKADLLTRIEEEREYWHRLIAKIDPEQMEEPGPMGEWSFKDLTAHLVGWRDLTIARLDAAGRGDEDPSPPWPENLVEDDAINRWIYQQSADRPVAEVLEAADSSYQRLASAVAALSEDDVSTLGRFPWLEGQALAEIDFFGHLHEEHEPDIHAWLASR